MNIKDNTILVTGGTSGFGLEFAKQLICLGNTVIVTGRDPNKLAQTKQMLPSVHCFQNDVSDPLAIKKLYQELKHDFPNLNILINNAGEMRKINLHDPSITVENISKEIEINLSGPIRMVQQFLSLLMEKKSAAIMNISSGLALIPFPISPIYGATKAGLHSYTKSLRVQMKNSHIKVFEVIAPPARTPLNDKFSGDVDSKTLMAAHKVVAAAIRGLQNDNYEVYPGVAKVLRIFSRIAPSFLLKQLSKPVDKMLAS